MRALMPKYFTLFIAEKIRLVLYRTTESINRWKSVEGNVAMLRKDLPSEQSKMRMSCVGRSICLISNIGT